ncbi:hypothetical protein HOP50_05g38580 [Chloropicon primus]|uniref:Uncharacterized protein n=1 Tax=Chloropicon primus TaxID=1764295 RepID=A0A5B8MLM3_9CHLO|nr:hypothetical protein A3770_05p38450 [Chloropicon primus]UPR00543.1 hypothetical protein HOP50_05g38580 [Chloropicon primus]|mmetsp:Transcript_6571/g.19377  ORF Transcript_6571/g.19377 Transcript_6571/m.19377 type:complete len:224 (+) Transcript_6571:132-803(+)|eukprot:QDZ21327.1 hypothetical protein A3770_05p38450 [Chloropicon primus]
MEAEGGAGASTSSSSLEREVEALRRSRESLALESKRLKDALSERDAEEEARREEEGERYRAQVRTQENNNRILLSELESQELEIERLFKDNHALASQLDEAREMNASWKELCEDLSGQNERLQEMLQESAAWSVETLQASSEGGEGDELVRLREQVSQFERMYREEQANSAKRENQVKRLETTRLQLTEEKVQVRNTFVPILATIEDRLLKLQQARKSRGLLQ